MSTYTHIINIGSIRDALKKNVIFSDIVTIAFDPHPPKAKSDMIM